jgi:hypothetical protein
MPELGVAELGLLALQLVAIAATIDAARRLAARLVPELAGAERAVAIAVLAAALAALVVQGLGFTGRLSAPWLVAAVGTIWIAAATWSSAPGTTAARDRRRDRWALVPILAAAAVFAPVAARALLSVPTDWDGLTYHLLYPTRWLQEGRILPSELGPPHDQAALYPANGEALHAFAMTLVRSDLLVAPGMVALAALFGVAVGLLARALGAAAPAAAGAGALAATLPALASRAASSYVEPLLDFGLAAALFAALRALERPERAPGWAALAGTAAGLAAGTKYVGAPFAAALLVALPTLLAGRGAGRRVVVRSTAACALTALVTGGGWYLRNLIVVGNPFFPSPFLGLPYLERPGLAWAGTSLAARWRELAADGALGEALFALPPGVAPGRSLGPAALFGLLIAVGVGARTLGRLATRRAACGDRDGARAFVAVGALVLAATYVALPTWDNPGLFRSLVRFAVPAAGAAFALAAAGLGAAKRGARAFAAASALAAIGHGALAGVGSAASTSWAGLRLLAVPALATVALVFAASRRRGFLRVAATAAACGSALVALLAAWAYREAGREARWLDPAVPFRDFAAAALAAERARPGAATVAWASSGHHEFLALFSGRRLERRVVGVPRHPAEREGFRRAPGEGSVVPVDPDSWRVELGRRGVDLLVVSRWRAAGGRWPIEESWAAAAGWTRLVDQPDFRVYEVDATRRQGSRGGPQPDSQPRAP